MPLSSQMEKQGQWLFKYRGILPLIIFIAAIAMYIRNEASPLQWELEGTRYELLYETFCLFVSLFGLYIRIYTVGYSASNTSGRNTERQVADVLNTEGIYSTVRNPLYLGNFFMWLGIAMLTGNYWFTIIFVLIYVLYYERIIYTEEQFLIKKFGQHYINWANKTPIIIPDLSKFRKNSYAFSWKKVLRQEKNGLAALFLIFCFFDIIGELVKPVKDYNEVLLVMGALSVLTYGVLKYLKYNTGVLR